MNLDLENILGWTSNETDDKAPEMFSEPREEILKTSTGEEGAIFDAQTKLAEVSLHLVLVAFADITL